MKYFEDRSSQYPNRKKLIVKDVKRDTNGEISEILAEVYRDEGIVSKEGTILNAEQLNAIIERIKVELSGGSIVPTNVSVSWVQKTGVFQRKTFRVDFINKRFYAKQVLNDRLSFSINNYTDYADIEVIETAQLNETTGSSTISFNFFVEFYTDQSCTNLFTKLTGKVDYTNMSTNPID